MAWIILILFWVYYTFKIVNSSINEEPLSITDATSFIVLLIVSFSQVDIEVGMSIYYTLTMIMMLNSLISIGFVIYKIINGDLDIGLISRTVTSTVDKFFESPVITSYRNKWRVIKYNGISYHSEMAKSSGKHDLIAVKNNEEVVMTGPIGCKYGFSASDIGFDYFNVIVNDVVYKVDSDIIITPELIRSKKLL